MPPITAMLHTCNDAPRLGRALESLRPCDEILVVDHGSCDATVRIAREYGAQIQSALPDSNPATPLTSARFDWVLCLLPSESLTEALEASLFEWKLSPALDVASVPACSAVVREETANGWREARPSTRLVPRDWSQWEGNLPREASHARLLEGHLLRFRRP